MAVDLERARAAKRRLRELLPKAAEVNGIGITQVGEDYAVKLNLAAPVEDLDLPDSVDGVPVVVEVVGRIAKRPAED
ncbi:MAG TPA: hypothetical protein VGS57_11465 [Thermoanaerobaculia bacterium]|nr:hypothetical protein [Thermoanaerobaculia bacterium]